MKKWVWRVVVVVAVVYAIFRFIDGAERAELVQVASWVLAGVIVSEIVLTVGIAGMLSIVGVHTLRVFRVWKTIGWNDTRIRDRIRDSGKWFWIFFWVSLVGGLGDGAVLLVAIFTKLPMDTWGAAIVPLADMWATLVIRRSIYNTITKTS